MQRGLGLAELNSNGQLFFLSISPTRFGVLFPGSAQRGSNQTKNDGQYVQCLKDEAAQSSQAALTPQAMIGFRSANCQL